MPQDPNKATVNQSTSTQSQPKKPNPPKSGETQSAIESQRESIGISNEMAQDAIAVSRKRGENLAIKAEMAEFSAFVETSAKLAPQKRAAFRRFMEARDEAVEAIEVEVVPEGINFFTYVCDSLASPALSSSAASASLPSSSTTN